ncbi:hypothetical protein PRIPAC_93958, partial [Pristionchus pacificus]|uniref:Uncharacterized protein n=1 Tax=Pristionchus pacificus TaxID=54126 RepID=A0A2A6CIH7_PRIPA
TPPEEYTIQPWYQIDSLECINKRWTVRVGGKAEVLPGNSEWVRPRHRALDDEGGWKSYCFRNRGRCAQYGGYCIHMHDQNYKEQTYMQRTFCACIWDPFATKKYNDLRRFHKPTCDLSYDKNVEGAPGTAYDRTKHICEPSKLEDGCTDDNCVKLKANATHVKCNEQLILKKYFNFMLNHGGDFFLDWHEVSGVTCIDNQWQSECSKKKIGKSKLMCSKDAPSSISSSLFLTVIISAVVLVLLIALTCACCLLRRKQRRVQQAASLARNPHSSRCPSSTRHSDNARTAREESSDEK